MPSSARIAYAMGAVLLLGGIILAAVGIGSNSGGSIYVCSNGTAFCSNGSTNAGLVVGGLGLAWIGIAALVAAYGRTKQRPFFPLLVAGLFIPFPLCLLALAVTTTVGAPAGPAIHLYEPQSPVGPLPDQV